MARYLAIEWDAAEARIAVARTRGADISVEEAFAVPLPTGEGDEADVGAAIAPILEQKGLAKVDAIAGVGRSNIELRLLQMPAAPPEELPEMVRFQAMRQFAAIGEEWPLDFTEVTSSADGDTINVLAAAISPKLVEQVRVACSEAQLEPQRIVLRPFAAASLLRRRGGAAGCRMVVDLLADEADLTVLADGQVALMRTVRLPQVDDPKVIARAMLGEMRRTIASAQNQLGGRRVEDVTVFGAGDEQGHIKEQAESQLSLNVTLFDPFDQVHLSGNLGSNLPSNHGRFAPLLGMLADELTGVRHDIDFLNPRRRPKAPSKTRQHSMAGIVGIAAVAAVVILLVGMFYKKNSELKELNGKIAEKQLLVDKNKDRLKQKRAIEKFLKTDVNWLDEFYRMAKQFPDRDDVMVDYVNARRDVSNAGGGVIFVKIHVKDDDVIPRLEKNLTDAWHIVVDAGTQWDSTRPDHPWMLTQQIRVMKSRLTDRDQIKSRSPSATNPAKSDAKKKAAAPDLKKKPATELKKDEKNKDGSRP